MEYLKKSFHKINNNKKLDTINEIIAELSKIKNSLETNLSGNDLLEFIEFDKSKVKDSIQELKQGFKKLNYSENITDYTQDEFEELNYLKQYIKKEEQKLEIIDEIISLTVDKDKNYDHNEGWQTTESNIKIIAKFKNNITLKVNFDHHYNGYDGSYEFYKYIYLYKDNNELKKNVDYYIENDKYYNGKKLNKNLNYFKKNLENQDFENISEEELISILHNSKKESETNKKKILENEKNKNTSWSKLLNKIIDKLGNKEKFMDYFD